MNKSSYLDNKSFIERLIENFSKDLKLLMFLYVLFQIYRGIFLWLYRSQLTNVELRDILGCFFVGGNLSINVIGWMFFVALGLISLPGAVFKNYPTKFLRKFYSCLLIFITTFLFITKISYYNIFNNSFDQMVLNFFTDDKWAILETAVRQYNLIPCVLLVLLLTYILLQLLEGFFRYHEYYAVKYTNKTKIIILIALLSTIYPLILLTRFGGTFVEARSLKWENAGRFGNHLLNEAVLDDFMALKRVHFIQGEVRKIRNKNITVEELRASIAILGGDNKAPTISQAFARRASGARLTHKPHNIFLIINESYGKWPLLAKFQELGLAAKTASLLEKEETVQVDNFLSNGYSTTGAMTAIVTGLDNVYLGINYQKRTYEEVYEMALGRQMHNLGYKTFFWYAGFPEWQNIEKITLAQGFDEFRSVKDYECQTPNVWGCSDGDLFSNVANFLKDTHSEEYNFHVIFTTGNHAPYSVDLKAEGFPQEQVVAKMGQEFKHDDSTIKHLGHLWYNDQEMNKFIAQAEKRFPDSLFAITGDHSNRVDYAKPQPPKVRASIPFILYGQGINKNLIAPNTAGNQTQIAATFIELIAPAGYKYYSILPALLQTVVSEFNYETKTINDECLMRGGICPENSFNYELNVRDGQWQYNKATTDEDTKKIINAMENLTVWRVKKGNSIE